MTALHYLAILLALSVNIVISQKRSPCPEVLAYESRKEDDRWYGVLNLRTADDLNGVWLHIVLDRPAQLLGNWFGEAASTDNREFSIRNQKYRLEAGPTVSVRFFVKYNAADTIPSVTSITLNGKTICSERPDQITRPTPPTLHISQIIPQKPNTEGQSISNRPTSRPSSSGNNNSNGRPNSSSGTDTPRPNLNMNRPTQSSVQSRPMSTGNRPQSPSPPTFSTGFGSQGEGEDSDDYNDDFIFPGDLPNLTPTKRPSIRPQTASNSQKSICGTVGVRPNALISNGKQTLPGQWPWHAALYFSKKFQLQYTCGGTIISPNHVITAAHCVTKTNSNKVVNKNQLLIYLGKHSLPAFGPEVEDRSVDDIYIHPQYNFSMYYNDLAILKLSKPIEITNYVRPCCIWDEENTDLNNIVGKQGTVVGWGLDESRQLSTKLLHAEIPVVSTVTCIYSNREFFSQFSFDGNFCAGDGNGTSVCNGDSGGGMVFPKRGTSGQNTVWQLRGIVSVGVSYKGQNLCDVNQYAIFTDVAKYVSWIRTIVN